MAHSTDLLEHSRGTSFALLLLVAGLRHVTGRFSFAGFETVDLDLNRIKSKYQCELDCKSNRNLMQGNIQLERGERENGRE